MASAGGSCSRRWADLVEEEEGSSESGSSGRSYSDVVRDGSPSPARAESAAPVVAAEVQSEARAPPARRIASVVFRSEPVREEQRRPGWGAEGKQPKRMRSEPRPATVLREGLPRDLAGVCFKCLQPEHVVGMCERKIVCLKCKGEGHIARLCTVRRRRQGPGDQGAGLPRRGADGGNWRAGVAMDGGQQRGQRTAEGDARGPAHARLGPRLESQGTPPPDARASAHSRLGPRVAEAADVQREPARASAFARLGERMKTTQQDQVVAGQTDWPALPTGGGARWQRSHDRGDPSAPGSSEQGARQGHVERDRAIPNGDQPQQGRQTGEAVRLGAPETSPESEICIVYRTPEVEAAERALRWSAVVNISGSRRRVPASAVATAIENRFPTTAGHFTVHYY